MTHRPIPLRLTACPACGAPRPRVFYEVRDVPVHSVLLMATPEEAVGYPRGDIALGLCESCGFIANLAFDPSKHEYSAKYEETQGFSGTFNAFHRALAERLIERHGLRGKRVIEIGCGKGEFLTMLCDLGGNTGIGFDPAYIPERNTGAGKDRVTFITDFYSEKYTHHSADFVCCKMTLEHIQDVGEFVSMVRRSIGDRYDTTVFFQIPEVRRVLRDRGFWDIYYEHCSYFSPGSLARTFRRAGFDVLSLGTEYDDQYLMIEARPSRGTPTPPLPEENDLEAVKADVAAFSADIGPTLERWRALARDLRAAGKRAVLWGGGSKAVAFLTTLGVSDDLPYAVDINPYKHGTYLAGNGQRIVGPEFLREYRPDVVIVMNPIYCTEIGRDLDALGVRAELKPV